MIAIATLIVLLGFGGALFGIHVANANKQAAAAGRQTSTSPVAPTTAATTPTASPASSPSPSATATTPAADAFPLPDLVGLDFRTARTKVRELRLGWRLEFEDTATGPAEPDPRVRATDPPAGSMVRRGTTIKIFVAGSAPPATVPQVVGLSCADAAAIIVDHGLYPRYPTGRRGTVISQSPDASDQSLRWNDEVSITCG